MDKVSALGGTPLVVCENNRILGVIYLKDTVKPGMVERFERLRAIGIKTIMCTGDNPLTAATIAKEAGVDGFVAECKPEDKIALIKKEQAEGKIVAMTGDGTNDAPALAQANVGLAMNSGTTAAKEAANMVDLDSDPTKILEVVEIGKQLLITRGSLTTFSIANDIAKYFAIIPAMFMMAVPAAGCAEHHGPGDAVQRHSVRADLQRHHHPLPDPAGHEGRQVPPHVLREDAGPEHDDLRPGRRHRPLRGHQDH